VELGMLTEQEVARSTDMEFNPVRVGFHGGHEVSAAGLPWVPSPPPPPLPAMLAAHPAAWSPARPVMRRMSIKPPPLPPAPGAQVWTRDVLNLGVSPRYLVDLMREKLVAAGGAILEQTGVSGEGVRGRGEGGGSAGWLAAALGAVRVWAQDASRCTCPVLGRRPGKCTARGCCPQLLLRCGTRGAAWLAAPSPVGAERLRPAPAP
jgi:hypothetical protein